MAFFASDFAHLENGTLAGKLLATFRQPLVLNLRSSFRKRLAHLVWRAVMAAGRRARDAASSVRAAARLRDLGIMALVVSVDQPRFFAALQDVKFRSQVK
jgi:hypothetical protein